MLAHASHIPFDTQVEYSVYEYLQCRIPVLSHLREEGVFVRASLLPILLLRSLSSVTSERLDKNDFSCHD